jgi:hypothetical protein
MTIITYTDINATDLRNNKMTMDFVLNAVEL